MSASGPASAEKTRPELRGETSSGRVDSDEERAVSLFVQNSCFIASETGGSSAIALSEICSLSLSETRLNNSGARSAVLR